MKMVVDIFFFQFHTFVLQQGGTHKYTLDTVYLLGQFPNGNFALLSMDCC